MSSLPLSRHELSSECHSGFEPEYLFFWGHTHSAGAPAGPWCLSQWAPIPFSAAGVTYATAEHYMMAGKARLFGDDEMLLRILAAESPAAAKALGRKVRGFVEESWNAHGFDIVVAGNVAKFGSSDELRDFLLSTGDKVLVEAAPRDRVWGIGLGKDDPKARHPDTWRGRNLLGFALMKARSILARGA